MMGLDQTFRNHAYVLNLCKYHPGTLKSTIAKLSKEKLFLFQGIHLVEPSNLHSKILGLLPAVLEVAALSWMLVLTRVAIRMNTIAYNTHAIR